jgi:hypothetical protein
MTTIATMHRGRFDGVRQILRFNRPLFVGAAAAEIAGAAVLASVALPAGARVALAVGLALAAFWAAATLAVAHGVYDRSGFYGFGWMPRLPRGMKRWINVHAGFDQTTGPLRAAFPQTCGIAVDLFDPAVMTEKSIRRARRAAALVAGTRAGRFDAWPVDDGEADAVFLLFAAHELRTAAQRAALFQQAQRVIESGGAVVMVEHLRGVANLVAFGPGAFHFHPRRAWLAAGDAAGLTLEREFPITPFATCMVWRKP